MTIAPPKESYVDVLVIGAGPAGEPLFRFQTSQITDKRVLALHSGVMCVNGLARYGIDVRIIDNKFVVVSLPPHG